MSDPLIPDQAHTLEPVHTGEDETRNVRWTMRLVIFLRVMAGLSMAKGLYHWAMVCGIGAPFAGGFQSHLPAWQTATVFFAVIDLVAAVGLWLAAAWGAVIWLTAIASMLAVQLFFPRVFEGGFLIVLFELALLAVYLWLALKSAQERPA